jgi:hypothetical protein
MWNWIFSKSVKACVVDGVVASLRPLMITGIIRSPLQIRRCRGFTSWYGGSPLRSTVLG